MQHKHLARIYICTTCGWKKILEDPAYAILSRETPPNRCAKCGFSELRIYRFESWSAITKRNSAAS